MTKSSDGDFWVRTGRGSDETGDFWVRTGKAAMTRLQRRFGRFKGFGQRRFRAFEGERW